MERATIDFGIDLGTTNSCIGVLKGTLVEMFRNNEGSDYTPSVIWIDKNNALTVGRMAKQQLENDKDNAACEFKLQMGKDTDYEFKRSGRKMKPEELSSEVLKSLKSDVKKRTDENVEAAVITVPAAFDARQCDATRKAAQLAGFTFSTFLQEPVAAALPYGFLSRSEKIRWLTYDMGGGTFDTAVIQVRDDVIQVVNHEGDNYLGGKLIDWDIVNHLLVPKLMKERKLRDFTLVNPKWTSAFAKLKMQAEESKIRLSNDKSTEISIEYLCKDDNGEPVEFEYNFKREDMERLLEPYVLRSINLCKKVLADKKLGVGNIEKILLVGGPTLTPYLRQRLADPNEGLGIALESDVDPLTVVARGAAIYAGTQRIERDVKRPEKAGQYNLKLEYKPIGADIEPLVGGTVLASSEEDLSGFSIEFVNIDAHPQWHSGKVLLGKNSTFMINLWAEKGRQNTFLIELYDSKGTKHKTDPDRITYTAAVDLEDPPLVQSIGIALANNEVAVFFKKGTSLPARKVSPHKIAYDVRCGQTDSVIKIPIIEGENRRADRNIRLGVLEIPASKIKHNILAGSDIEITIVIDKSRMICTKAFIPILDDEFETVHKFEKESADPQQLKENVETEAARLAKAKERAGTTTDLKAQQIIMKIEDEKMEQEINEFINSPSADKETADRCEKRLRDLTISIDELEDALQWPVLLAEAEEQVKSTRDIVTAYGSNSDKLKMETLENEINKAIGSRDADLLKSKIGELWRLGNVIMSQRPEHWTDLFHDLENERDKMTDQARADVLFTQGNRAIDSGNMAELEAAVRQLLRLLPTNKQEGLKALDPKKRVSWII
ncbi:Hsp70 family protein [Candidatus Magnetominusculus xianensis]|uniref:Heat shock protein 70 n=1 Tax=Candidatus Magnetominusculus xianensis TaxID=1748249 RepID=A0ABR5SK14_9BACT|nr:Hsp70 family protein [Candidatus Magnetominusculus xianensis]KWT95153.1 Heat shock protein 70 [Candidatus Magnetominusculus xianensis]MBF0402800.1 Hsp70 family protein [Nitrospirota bacterium]